MSKHRIERNIVFDEPSNEDQFQGKGHERTAFALSMALAKFSDDDRAIGLDGPWGSGKSSVVEMAEAMLKKQNKSKPVRYSFFTFDLWKAQGSVFRRSYLEHFLTWAKNNYPKKRKQISEIQHKVTGKTREIETDNKPLLDWFGIATVLLLPFLPIYYFWAKSVFDELDKSDKLSEFFCSAPVLVLLAYILTAIGKSVWDTQKSDGEFKTNLTKTLLLSSRRHEDQKLTQTIRETDPNDYEFQKVFREILAIIQSEKDRVVVVLDNIDRLPKNDILENWAQMRAIFSHNVAGSEVSPEKAITAIIPYDRKLVERATDEGAVEEAGNPDHISKLDERELFAKTFDEILVVSPPVMSSTREFFTKNLKTALPKLDADGEVFRAYLVLKQISDASKRALTPRQIINFINELSGLYALHEGEFALPTIAVFIAYRDKLEEEPGLLTNMDQLGDRIRRLADDPQLERNLASIVFNVEPALAFQVLLAPQINLALRGDDSTHLEELSNAAGFDVTIVETIQNNGQEWSSAGDLFTVIHNVNSFFEKYRGQAKEQISQGLVDAFKYINIFDAGSDDAKILLDFIKIAPKNGLSNLGINIIDCAFEGATQNDETLFLDGSELISFLDDATQAFGTGEAADEFKFRIGNRRLKDNPEFIVGAASAAYDRDISISDFHMLPLRLSENYEQYFNSVAVDDPEAAFKAFSELHSSGLMAKEAWPKIASVIIEQTKVEEGSRVGHLKLLSYAWSRIDWKGRGKIPLNELFESTNAYENIYRLYHENEDQSSLTSALFLAGCQYSDKEPPSAMQQQSDGNVIERITDAVSWFREILAGDAVLVDDEYSEVAQKLKEALVVTNWTENASNQFDTEVLHRAYMTGDIPGVTLSTVLKNFDYLQVVFGDEPTKGLSRLSERINDKELGGLKISDCANGVLTHTNKINVTGWKTFHERIGELLVEIPAEEWAEHFIENDHTAGVLIEKISTSGLIFKEPKFRTEFINLILGILSGSTQPKSAQGMFDIIVNAIPKDFHGDVLREIREKMSGVTSSTIVVAHQQFPELLGRIISEGKQIMATEKHNVVRHLLCSALEAGHEEVLSRFNELGYSKVSGYLKKSDETTQNKVKGAYDNFAKTSENENLVQTTGATIYSKTKSKSIVRQLFELNPFFHTSEPKDDN